MNAGLMTLMYSVALCLPIPLYLALPGRPASRCSYNHYVTVSIHAALPSPHSLSLITLCGTGNFGSHTLLPPPASHLCMLR